MSNFNSRAAITYSVTFIITVKKTQSQPKRNSTKRYLNLTIIFLDYN